MASEDNPKVNSAGKSNLSRTPVVSQLGRAVSATEQVRTRVGSILEPYRSIIQSFPISAAAQAGFLRLSLDHSPEIARVGAVITQLRASPLIAAAQRVGVVGLAYQQQLDRMRSSVLDWTEMAAGMSGAIKLQTIGQLVRLPASYDQDVSSALRDEFGDWRDPMTFQDNPEGSRSDFYQNMGFDGDLVAFSDDDFPVIAEQTGILRPVSEIEQLLGPFLPAGYATSLDAGDLELQAFNWLRTLERAIRHTLDRVMTDAFGPNWPKARLPNGMHEQWQSKKQKVCLGDRSASSGEALIEFADFSDYSAIILRRDNWKEVFARFWQRPEDVRESFQRLHYIRIETMHSRSLIKPDLIQLYSEGRRLLEALAKYHRG